MQGRTSKWVTGLCLLTLSGSLQAGLVIDQQQTTADWRVASLYSRVGQSFRQDADNVAGVGIYVRGSGGKSLNVTLSLYAYKDLISPKGTFLASTTTSLNTSAQGWFDVYFDTPVLGSPGDAYFFEFTSPDQSVLNMTVMGAADTYSFGPLASGDAFWWASLLVEESAFMNKHPLPYDLAFRTWAQTDPVPAPGALALGLLGIVCARLRRRA